MSMDGYKVRKAAQVAAFFAMREGGRVNVLKLAKLLYLADREHMDRYDMPILFDIFVSMQNGPVTSITLDYVRGMRQQSGEWDAFVTDRSHHDVSVASDGLSVDHLDELSEAEIETLDHVWGRFRHMNGFELADWTHEHCPEWEDPSNSSYPIPYERVLKHLGKDRPAEIARHIEDMRAVDRAFTVA